jgi:hypothetical protein
MVIEVLSPGMQHRRDADLRAEMLGIGGDGGQRLGGGRKQQAIDLSLVLVRDGADHSRQGEHHMEVWDRQKLGFSCRKPICRGRPLTLIAVAIATRVVRDARVGAVFAALDVAAERGRAACLDRRHDA